MNMRVMPESLGIPARMFSPAFAKAVDDELRRREVRLQHHSLLHDPKSKYHDLLKAARYKVFYGGRGAAKDWTMVEALVERMDAERTRVLCTREFQNSIKDSVHQVFKGTIERLALGHRFEVTDKTIRNVFTGSDTVYKGLRNNPDEIKSTEGINIALVAEAQNLSLESLRILTPTIRAPKSEIWISLNVTDVQAAVYNRFVTNHYPGAIVHKVNYTENPFFPEELRKEMEYDKENDFEAYQHIWEGFPKKISDAVIFGKRFRVASFDPELYKRAERLFYGADFGFSSDPAVLLRMFIIENTLYIEYEAWGLGVELEDYVAFYEGGIGGSGKEYAGIPLARDQPIIADNARPEIISFIRRKGFNIKAADKWKGSVEDGIAHLKGFREIVIHERCVHTAQEARLYSYKVDSKNGEVLPDIIDKHNHCWDSARYALDGYIKRRGSLEKWAKLAG